MHICESKCVTTVLDYYSKQKRPSVLAMMQFHLQIYPTLSAI